MISRRIINVKKNHTTKMHFEISIKSKESIKENNNHFNSENTKLDL